MRPAQSGEQSHMVKHKTTHLNKDEELQESALSAEDLRKEAIKEFARRINDSPELFKIPDMNLLLIKLVDSFLTYHDRIQIAMSDTSNFLTLGQLEDILIQAKQCYSDIDLNLFLKQLNNVDCENELIVQKKTTSEPKE
jgi:hypothetical protein